MPNGPRFSTGKGTPLSKVIKNRNEPMSYEEMRLGPSSPKPPSYKLSISKGKITLTPVKKTTGRNIVSQTEVEEFATDILPEGGKEKLADEPRLGGYLPEEAYVPERRTGYGKLIEPPPEDTRQLKPTVQRREGLQKAGPMDTRGGSQLVRNNSRRQAPVPNTRERLNPITILPQSIKSPQPPERIENTASKIKKPNRAYEGDPEFGMREVNPAKGEFEKGMWFYGGGKEHRRKKRKKRTYGKKYAKGGGIRKPTYS